MSEATTPPPQHNTGDTVFKYTQPRLLTEEERQALVTRDDHGIQAIPMREFDSDDAFQRGQNNFHMTFTAQPGMVAREIYRGKMAFQRFRVLYPELCQTADDRLQGRNTVNFSPEDWSILHQAYDAISHLVDIGDPRLISNGEVRTGELLA